jgi:outer membrane murein-binding lipoprotein Lpp
MSLRAQVDEFCKNATGLGKKIEKLEAEVKTLKEKLKAPAKTRKAKVVAEPAKAEPKKTRKVKVVVAEPVNAEPKKTRKVTTVVAEPVKAPVRKLTEEEKGQRRRERAVTKELEKRQALGLPPI